MPRLTDVTTDVQEDSPLIRLLLNKVNLYVNLWVKLLVQNLDNTNYVLNVTKKELSSVRNVERTST